MQEGVLDKIDGIKFIRSTIHDVSVVVIDTPSAISVVVMATDPFISYNKQNRAQLQSILGYALK